MARKAVTVTTLTPNAGVADPAGTEVDATEGNVVSGVPLEELVLEISLTSEGGGEVTIVAGDNPPASSAGQGSVKVALEKEKAKLIGPFTSARFIQAGSEAGKLHLDWTESDAGKIKAYHVPRTA